jgi:hypothetical protein
VHEKGRGAHLGRVEAPGADAREIVFDEPFQATGEGGLVFWGELRLPVGLGQVLLQRRAPGRRRA